MARAAIAVLLLSAVACSPGLIVRHMDPTHDVAEVWVDGYRVGTVEYDDRLVISVAKGRHVIKVVPPGRTDSPWHVGRPDVTVVLENDAVMTLLPRATPQP